MPGREYEEVLDISLERLVEKGWLERLEKGKYLAGAVSRIDFDAQPLRMRTVEAEYGRETLRFIIYWCGPHTSGGSPPVLRLDITRDEVLAFEPARRALNHGFSDAGKLGPVELKCYALEEMMAEKLRAVLGQRIYAVSRDLYDIFSLRGHVYEREVLKGLARRGRSGTDPERLIARKDEFRADWERNLLHLFPPGAERDFEEVGGEVISQVTRVTDELGRSRGR